MVVERMAYDPFGKRRFPRGATDAGGFLKASISDRGFTTAEHFDEMSLIHLNGRMYDPGIGRFMSADPGVPYPLDMQSYNRYSYVRNNPTGSIDPSGYVDVGANSSFFTNVIGFPADGNSFSSLYGFNVSIGTGRSIQGSSQGAVLNVRKPVTFGEAKFNSVSGYDPKGLYSALRDTGVAGWNAGGGLVEGGLNLMTFSIPGQVDYYPFFERYRKDYDTPFFGGIMEFVLSGGTSVRSGSVLRAEARAAALQHKATLARNKLLDEVSRLGVGSRPETVIGGYNTVTGQVIARACGRGPCAEDYLVEALGGDKSVVKFTRALRVREWRAGKVSEQPVCLRCQGKYEHDQFPRGTDFRVKKK